MIDIGIREFTSIIFRQLNFQFKGGLSHGWFDKGEYLRAPYIHQKNLYIKKNINAKQSLSLGIIHMAVWGGSTKIHGEQPQTFSDFSTTTTFDQKAQEMEKKVHNVRKNYLFFSKFY